MFYNSSVTVSPDRCCQKYHPALWRTFILISPFLLFFSIFSFLHPPPPPFTIPTGISPLIPMGVVHACLKRRLHNDKREASRLQNTPPWLESALGSSYCFSKLHLFFFFTYTFFFTSRERFLAFFFSFSSSAALRFSSALFFSCEAACAMLPL